MHIQTDVSLKHYSTMRLGGLANALVEVQSKEDLLAALQWAKERQLPHLMLGGGSNVIFSNGFPGLVIVNKLQGFQVLHKEHNEVIVQIGAGENWDTIVGRTVEMGLSGIEKLSLIPGTAGATPVQNVGAYGAEIADTFVKLEAYDLAEQQFVTLNKEDCQFSYRNSIFKSPKHRRYIITSLTLRLSTKPPEPPFYDTLQKYLDKQRVRIYTPQIIRDAVIAIRASKLPDPKYLPNIGSFFKNPIISEAEAVALRHQYPDVPSFAASKDRVKIAAGWLIDTAGLKGYTSHGMRVYEKNALVFVNDSANSFEDLAAFKQEIIDTVHQKFGIVLEQEPELIA